MKDYLQVADLAPADLARLLELAAELKAEPHRERGLLEGETVAMYFAKPSTRTRISLTAAIGRLGGIPEMLSPDELQLGRGETIEDTARVVSRYVKAFVIRTFSDDDVRRFAAAATIPVVNALTDLHHPCQALADLLTLRERLGRLEGLKVAYLGAGNNVTHSLMDACALAGMHIAVATSAGFGPHPALVARAQRRAEETDGSVSLTGDPLAAVEGADAVYTDVWLSMGDDPGTRELRRHALAPYRVDAELLAHAKPGAVFLHCLPAHRGDEVTDEVIDGPQSAVFDQAENRLCTEQAVLVALLRGELAGAA